MKTFTVWFRIGMDFKETIEAEDVSDAERRVVNEVDRGQRWYLAQVRDGYTTHIYDIVEGVPDE